MVPKIGTEADPLAGELAGRGVIERRLRAEPWTFEFFQAVRLLGQLQPNRAAIGEFSPPQNEVVRIGAHSTLGFPASQIQGLTWEPGKQPSMRVNFMGATGPLGVLPPVYTELIIERLRSRDPTMRDFFDIFHHRVVSLFYQAWEKSRFTIGYERSRQDRFTESLFDLTGLGTPGLRNRQSVLDETIVFYGGLFGMATRPAAALEGILSDFFDVDVEIEQFVGVWRALDPTDQCFFETGEPASYQLGIGAVAGDEVWDRQSRARIRIGPLPAEKYLEFLPTGSAYEPLRALTKAFCGNDIEFEVQLILRRPDVPHCELGNDGPVGPQLGWFSWMKSKPDIDRDPSDTILLLT